jgi:hypothetical protein
MKTSSCCLLVLAFAAFSFASLAPAAERVTPLRDSSDHIATGAVHLVNFSPLEEADVEMQCAASQPPKPLSMPHPALAEIPDHMKITINLIIGSDGEVYSPFVIDGVSSALDRKVVDTVRHWHYRPALCNGVPTDAEVKLELSSR